MKRSGLAAILLTAFLTVSATLTAEVRQYDKSEWKIRPWEIINGLQPYSQLVWHCDNGDLAQPIGVRFFAKGANKIVQTVALPHMI